jgi:hypothetical protein
MSTKVLTAVEGIKARSNFLRGSIAASLADSATGALAPDDTQLASSMAFTSRTTVMSARSAAARCWSRTSSS